MKKMNKLVALLLAAVMVLGMMPTMSVHAHAHGAELQGIEEYPALPLNTETFVDVNEFGKIAYFTFTPRSPTCITSTPPPWRAAMRIPTAISMTRR